MPIEVFAELTCPFTHLALRRIVERRRDTGLDTPTLRIRPWPLELVNGEPLDPHHVGDEVTAIRAQVAPELFVGFDASSFPATSMPGFRLVEAAYAADPAVGEAVSLALRDALFEQGHDIADAAVLADVAARLGVSAPSADLQAQVEEAYAEGRRRGVDGSPHFFVDGDSSFCPLLDIRTDDAGQFHVSLDEAAVNDRIDGWFATAGQ